MSTIFNTFIVPLTIADTKAGVCVNLNKAIDSWLSMIKGHEIGRTQATIGSAPIAQDFSGKIVIGPVISVTVEAERD